MSNQYCGQCEVRMREIEEGVYECPRCGIIRDRVYQDSAELRRYMQQVRASEYYGGEW